MSRRSKPDPTAVPDETLATRKTRGSITEDLGVKSKTSTAAKRDSITEARRKELNQGHRQRMRERFLKDPHAMADYELLEILLYSCQPRRDVRTLAKQILECYQGKIWDLFHASPQHMQILAQDRQLNLSDSIIATVKLVTVLSSRIRYRQIEGGEVYSRWEDIHQYCQGKFAHLDREELHLLLLDKHSRLFYEEKVQVGNIDSVTLYPDEIARRSLNLGAKSLILVHNHPSGDPRPSYDDMQVTRNLARTLRGIGIEVLDHLVVSHSKVVSMRKQGLLDDHLTFQDSVKLQPMMKERTTTKRLPKRHPDTS